MNKMKYLGERNGRNVNDRDDTHSVLWGGTIVHRLFVAAS